MALLLRKTLFAAAAQSLPVCSLSLWCKTVETNSHIVRPPGLAACELSPGAVLAAQWAAKAVGERGLALFWQQAETRYI